mmetsp:Transcript_61320/g.179847  ORF Transcript_61320/g.179847 Transcript_61320/m.179847 type:complete len:209 (+) Transcript_61320:670-1296(+)
MTCRGGILSMPHLYLWTRSLRTLSSALSLSPSSTATLALASHVPGMQPSTPRLPVAQSLALPVYPRPFICAVHSTIRSVVALVQTTDRANSMTSREGHSFHSIFSSSSQPFSCQMRPMLTTLPSSSAVSGCTFISMPFRETSVSTTLIFAPMLFTHSPCSVSMVIGVVGAGLGGALGSSGSGSTGGVGGAAGSSFGEETLAFSGSDHS